MLASAANYSTRFGRLFRAWGLEPRRLLAVGALFAAVLLPQPLCAADTRDALIFEINSALRSRDPVAFVHCFNFQGTDQATRQEISHAIEQIVTWPSFYITTSERKDSGRMVIEKEGKPYALNGDWSFQVHIYAGKPPSSGFIFPAGTDGKQCLILLMVGASTAPASNAPANRAAQTSDSIKS